MDRTKSLIELYPVISTDSAQDRLLVSLPFYWAPSPISSSYSLPWSMKTSLYRQFASTHRKLQSCSLGKARNSPNLIRARNGKNLQNILLYLKVSFSQIHIILLRGLGKNLRNFFLRKIPCSSQDPAKRTAAMGFV